jgi:CheY-like chemotaxis protein
MGMYDFSFNTSADYYFNESEKISGSFDAKYYDEIITKLHLQARAEYESTIHSPEQEKLQEEKMHNQKSKARKRILVVDDEHDTCLCYQIVLEDAGFECHSYTDSIKALQEFRPLYYNLVILDIKMPILNGFALCEKIREVDKAVQIIFITAAEGYYENFRKQYYPELSNDININCLQKPIGNEELIQIVNMTIATKYTN